MKDGYFSKFLGQGLRYEISDFAYMIQGHRGRYYKFTPEDSIAIASIMERFLAERFKNENMGAQRLQL